MTVAMIWAQDLDGVLGDGKRMLWHCPNDFKHFKNTTLGYPVIMGRGSWEALGEKPLPGRENIVLTSQAGYEAPGAIVAHSLEEAIEIGDRSSDLVWIVGGGRVYEDAMEFADELVVSEIDLEVEGGDDLVYAPEIDENEWTIDESRTDEGWRSRSGDARWRVTTYVRFDSE
ncbi:MAG: dihydrofolate reductase [Actinomycetaceae bacterium]|nr:dihydrofolate reductase [Actinomycetaceae bacterium]